MAHRPQTTERLGNFSDGVFSVIITIMVLELKPPEHPTFAALVPLWPTTLSYLVSYYFVAIVWINHHHLLRFFPGSSPRLIWINFVHMFMVSLVPFSTAWVADTKLASVPVFVYAGECGSVRAGKFGLYPIRVARPGIRARRSDFGPHAAVRQSTLVIYVGSLRHCDAGVAQSRLLGFWVGVLRFAGLLAA